MPTVTLCVQLYSILCQTGLSRHSFVIFDIRAQPWASECPDDKNYKWRLNPVWHRMLYGCAHMATVGVKGLTRGCGWWDDGRGTIQRVQRSAGCSNQLQCPGNDRRVLPCLIRHSQPSAVCIVNVVGRSVAGSVDIWRHSTQSHTSWKRAVNFISQYHNRPSASFSNQKLRPTTQVMTNGKVYSGDVRLDCPPHFRRDYLCVWQTLTVLTRERERERERERVGLRASKTCNL